MTEYKTLRVPADDYETAKDSKRESETWGEFLQRCTDTPPQIREFVDAADTPDDSGTEAIDYAEIERRCREAVKDALPDTQY